jgi:hypothetical protein
VVPATADVERAAQVLWRMTNAGQPPRSSALRDAGIPAAPERIGAGGRLVGRDVGPLATAAQQRWWSAT